MKKLVAPLLTLFCVASYFLANRFIVTTIAVQGRSMSPTLDNGKRYYLNRWFYLFRAPCRGDVVVVKDPNHDDYAAKRIIAGPSDFLFLKEGVVYLNGQRLSEPYLGTNMRTDSIIRKNEWLILGPSEYYLMGDNRILSEDSRYYGPVRRSVIIGRIVAD